MAERLLGLPAANGRTAAVTLRNTEIKPKQDDVSWSNLQCRLIPIDVPVRGRTGVFADYAVRRLWNKLVFFCVFFVMRSFLRVAFDYHNLVAKLLWRQVPVGLIGSLCGLVVPNRVAKL